MSPQPQSQPTETITCTCGHLIFDGEVVRSRCVKVHDGTALCRCKKWVSVPVQVKCD